MDDHRQTGFTLVELLVVLALVAILLGVAVPAMRDHLDSARLQAAAEALVRELQLARNHAITHGTPVFFSWSTQARGWCYGWSDRDACACNRATAAGPCSNDPATPERRHTRSSTEFPATRLLSRQSTPASLRFSPLRGTATATTFTVQGRRAELRVIVSPLGRIRLCSPAARGYRPC